MSIMDHFDDTNELMTVNDVSYYTYVLEQSMYIAGLDLIRDTYHQPIHKEAECHCWKLEVRAHGHRSRRFVRNMHLLPCHYGLLFLRLVFSSSHFLS